MREVQIENLTEARIVWVVIPRRIQQQQNKQLRALRATDRNFHDVGRREWLEKQSIPESVINLILNF